MIRFFFLLSLITSFAFNIQAQNERSHIRSGNELFMEQKYADAEVEYKKAIDKNPQSFKATFNNGDALYQQEKYDEAIKEFKIVTTYEKDKSRLANTWYNIGNSNLKLNKYQDAVDAYKNALRNNPTDMDAKYNLEYAKKKLEQQQNGQSQQQQEKQEKQEQKQQEQKQEENKQEQKEQQSKENKISKEDAERLLESLEKNEEDTREKVEEKKKENAKQYRIEKDW